MTTGNATIVRGIWLKICGLFALGLQLNLAILSLSVHTAPAPPEFDATDKGWVKLIGKSWYLGRGAGRYSPLEAIEGVTEDVGWMKEYTCYDLLHKRN